MDKLNQTVLLKNFKWEGFMSYARLRSSTFGSVYFGNGLANSDVYFTV